MKNEKLLERGGGWEEKGGVEKKVALSRIFLNFLYSYSRFIIFFTLFLKLQLFKIYHHHNDHPFSSFPETDMSFCGIDFIFFLFLKNTHKTIVKKL